MKLFSLADVWRLLHNKYVVALGDSILYSKDLVKILQNHEFRTENQLKGKGGMSFANDTLGDLHNGIPYREVRHYRTDHHLVQSYFLTCVSSEYVESMLADFEQGPQPDVVIIN
uniref:Uncharacterized protein n=1 Tax=Pyxicephalus adspersus TaxID=30357 RepID=A0AAV3A5M7_PYXAD|nr:TPA: hypothetical protein GDO54_017743 [Pyxicephalus adspersus]